MKRRLIGILLVVFMLVSFAPVIRINARATTNKTQAEAVSWAESQIGKSLDYDGANGAQCVDLIFYYYRFLGKDVVWGNGCDFAGNALPSGWSRIRYSKGVKPQPGDIAVWTVTDSGNTAGHVAIVTDTGTDSYFVGIDQNWSGHYCERVTHRYSSPGTIACFIRPDFSGAGTPSYNPQGVLDDVTGGAGSVSIRGWAFDRDNLSKALEIHVYIGGPAGSGEGHAGIIAGASRPDVNNVYPGVGNNHGFSATISTNKTGAQPVYVYAINVGGGTNVELGHKTVTISSGHSHTMKHVEAKSATCTAEGNIEYWYCTGCRKYFKDAAGKTEISAGAVVTPKKEHFILGIPIYDSLGYQRYIRYECLNCGYCYVEVYTGPPVKNHSFDMLKSGIPAILPFTDVDESAYYCDSVVWAVYHDPQVTNGTSPTTFSPDATCTRGQVVTFLWRAKGCPEPTSTTNPFTDVPSNEYYYKAVLWAVEQGITNGTSATTFSPNAPCTRAHVVTFLWRAENEPAAGSANPFKDVPAGQYYTDAVLWAVSKNITNGTSANTFSPDNPCTRGQIVTFLYRDMK